MRLTSYDSTLLDNAGKYYNDGYVLLPIRNQQSLVILLNDILLGNGLKEGYFWEKSMNSYALRPQAYDYDESILNFLFDNDMPQKLKDHTNKNLVLSHVQVTKTEPGRSYQDWHRDTYQHGESKWVGNTPPAHKIIFYPVNKKKEPRLKFVRASHRLMMNNPTFDESVIKNFENEILTSDNDRAFLFDTSMLHGVIPDETSDGSIRIIYNFMSEEQYVAKYAQKQHHKSLHDLYLQRLNK